jgi:uncharacterized protein YuzE
MRVTYDPQADAAYISLRDPIGDGESKRQVVCDDGGIAGDIILDFDKEGVLLGIEVLRARRLLPKELLDSVTPDR